MKTILFDFLVLPSLPHIHLISAGGQFAVVVIIQGIEGIVHVLGNDLEFLDVASRQNLK